MDSCIQNTTKKILTTKTNNISIPQTQNKSYVYVNNNTQYFSDYNNFFPCNSPPNTFMKTLEKRYQLYHQVQL